MSASQLPFGAECWSGDQKTLGLVEGKNQKERAPEDFSEPCQHELKFYGYISSM